MLTLDAALAAAQNNQSRRPLAEIISSQRVADIPFDGTRLTAETFNEYAPSIIAHSSGRLVLAYVYYSGTTSGIKFVYTDTDRTEFTTVDLPLYTYANNEIKAVSICELTGGNIGMILLVDDKQNHLYRLTRRIYTVLGVAVSNAEIANWSHDTFTGDPWVMTKGTNDSMIVYTKISGSDYYVYKRTSADFLTWAAEAQLTIAGLTSTWRLDNPSLLKITTGETWLWFDVLEASGPNGEELTNVYYSTSTDGGSTWSAAAKFTAYTQYSETGMHPVALQKTANQITMMFTRLVSALRMDDTTTGWPTGDSAAELSFDSVNRKLYVTNIHPNFSSLQCVIKIDVDTWEVDKYWDASSTPAAFPSFLFSSATVYPYIHKADQYFIPVSAAYHLSGGLYVTGGVCLLNGDADTIEEYWFQTDASRGITQNVVLPAPTSSGGQAFWDIVGVQVDIATDRLYVLLVNDYGSLHRVLLGYITLSDAGSGSPTMYTWNTVMDSQMFSRNDLRGLTDSGRQGGFRVVPAEDLFIISCAGNTTSPGRLSTFQLSDGALIKDYKQAINSDFPYFGINNNFHYADSKIWGGFDYHAGDDQRGLCELNLSTDTCSYHRPDYASVDDYALKNVVAGPTGKLIVSAYGYGVAVLDTTSYSWELWNNTNIPGMTPDGYNYFHPIYYDAVGEFIFTGAVIQGSAWSGLLMFSIYGFIRQANYSIGTWSGSAWTWSAIDELVQGYLDHQAAGVPDPDTPTSMFVFWTHETWAGVKSIKWDKDGSSLDLAPYLAGEIATERSIDGSPAKLAFSVSHGHLFDPYNLSSAFNLYLKKGRKLTLRWGEKIGGTDYWQNGGTFFVTGTSLGFKRGEYPVMKVDAEDQRCIWAHSHVYATELYNGLPKYIIEQVLQDHAGLAVGDLNIPVFIGGTVLEHQWLDTTVDEIINQVCNRFGYFFRFDVDGLAHARRITNAGSIDHTYTDNDLIIEFSPDDKYSDFTNRVTVQGQELDFTQVLFTEESIGTLNGTVGWWGFNKDFQVWYSDDHSRQCMNPRLEVIETVTSIAFKLAGNISETMVMGTGDDADKYCTITVSAPNLIPLLAGAVALYTAGNYIGDLVETVGFIANIGMTTPLGRRIEGVALIMAMMVLGSTGNYQYAVHGQPVGSVRRSVQGSWNDEEHQTEIDAIVEQVINDPLCYSVADCNAVAAFEGMVAQMQRKQVTISKIAHLQDEEADTIRVVHPYSRQNITLFATTLKRKFKKSDPGKDDGYFLDEIEGWLV